MKLTNTVIKNAKPKDRTYKLFDGQGLFLNVTTSGKRYWRLKYCWHGKEKLLALGVYPEVGLAEARKARGNARKLVIASHPTRLCYDHRIAILA